MASEELGLLDKFLPRQEFKIQIQRAALHGTMWMQRGRSFWLKISREWCLCSCRGRKIMPMKNCRILIWRTEPNRRCTPVTGEFPILLTEGKRGKLGSRKEISRSLRLSDRHWTRRTLEVIQWTRQWMRGHLLQTKTRTIFDKRCWNGCKVVFD